MSKTILITGATSGFGQAIAEKFASEKWNCIITARRKERLDELAQTLQRECNVSVLPMVLDIRNRHDVFETLSQLQIGWQSIDVLVNNAGLAAGRDLFDEASVDDWDTMIDTNVKACSMSQGLIPFMIAKGHGHIINIGSTAAKEVYREGNVYCATKHAVDAISEAQRIDLFSIKSK